MRKAIRRITTFIGPIAWKYVLTGALSAFLLVLSFPTYSLWWLAFVGFVPFLLGLLQASTLSEVGWMGFAAMTSFILIGYTWISFVATNFGGLPWIVGKLVLVAFSLFAEAQFLVFAWVAFALMRKVARLPRLAKSEFFKAGFAFVFLPLLYLGLDDINPKIFASSWGHVLYNWLSVAQLAEFAGVYGLTLPVVVCNFAVAALVFGVLKRKGGEGGRSFPGVAPAILAIVVLAVFFWRADRWGRSRMGELARLEASYSKTIKVGVVQANIGDIDKLASEKGFEPAVEHVLSVFHDMSLESVHRFHPDLLVWPETAWPFLYTHLMDSNANRAGMARDGWIRDFMGEAQTPLFFGSYSSVAGRDYNTAFLVSPPFELTGVYQKSILLAFGEYVPLGPLAPLVQQFVPTIADFGRGHGPAVLELKGVRFGPQICYEGIVPEYSRGAVALGADVLLNITNDSWFGDTHEPWLHLLLTVFRSIELRRPMLRSTNTGVSTVVDITGRLHDSTPLFKPSFIETTLRAPGPGQQAPNTFYLRHGEWFAQACAALAWLVVAALVLPAVLARLPQNK